VRWAIRFRPRVPLAGGLLQALVQPMLDRMLRRGLKPFAEGR
jgi:hypothetical protein